jgi:outer membrane protein insertion porin family
LALAVALTLGLAPAALAAPDAKPSEKPAADKPAAKPAESPDEYGPPVVAPPGGLAPKKPTEPPAVNEAKTLIKSIAVRGNQRIGDDRILLSIPISPGDKVGRSEVMDAIQRIYGMGYFQDVKAGSEPVAGGERLVFTVVENPVMGDVTFEGVTKVDPKKLEELFQSQKGDTINYNNIKEAVDKLQKTYADAGYPLARVADMNVAPGGILVLRIAEGKVHHVKVSGNEETKDYVVLREVSTKPGDIFNAEKIKQDLRRIYNLNYFEEINLKFEPAPTPEEVVVVIDVKEKQTGSINLGAGYSTRDGILGMFSVKKDNLMGTGQQVGVDLSISQQLQLAGELTYFNPWFDDHRTGLGGSLYVRRFNNFLANFREDRYGVSANASRPLFGDSLGTPWRGTTGIRLESVKTFDNVFVGGNPKPTFASNDDPRLAGKQITLDPSGNDTILAGSFGITYDTRDVIMNPTEGWFNQVTLEPGLVNPGQGLSPLLRSSGAATYFLPLPPVPWSKDRSTLAVGTRLGLINGFNSLVPAYERFYSTGPYLIRGWPEFATPDSDIGRKYPLNFFQGSNVAIGSLEYRFPIFNIVSGVVFADSGLFWDNSFTDQYGNFLLHSGYGAGLRLNTPLGPIRLDYGMSGLEPGQFHFSIGQKF